MSGDQTEAKPCHCTVDVMPASHTQEEPLSSHHASSGSSSSSVYSTQLTARVVSPPAQQTSEQSGPQLIKCCKRPRIQRMLRAHIGTFILMLVTLTVGLLTAHSYFAGQTDRPNCAMSYSRPQYIEQTEFGRSWTRYSAKYKLFLYREGGYDVHDTANRIPVLFVPGNAGSHKQVRSIASATATAFVEMLGKSPELLDKGCIGYDFFTLGLNEELTALHGYSIVEQADFVNDAIRYILAQYPRARARHRLSSQTTEFALPESVIVIGHSMGGVVARTAFMLPNHIPGSVQALFTLSTPHNNPTASLEWHVEQIYSQVNHFWRHGFHNGTLNNVSLVSIAGGNLDSMINSDYTYVGHLAPPRNALSVLSSGINDVWLSQDHQSILWCAQMARKFALLLMHIMDARQPSQLVPLDQRMDIMRRQLYPAIDYKQADHIPYERITSLDNYRYIREVEGAVKLYPTDMRMLAENSQERRNKARGLHLLQLPYSYDQIVQIIYDPWLFSDTLRDYDEPNAQVALLGCNRTSNDNVQCTTLSIPTVTKLPLKRDGDDPRTPVRALHYIEYPVKEFAGFSYLGVEVPVKYGTNGFLRAVITKQPQPRISKLGVTSTAIKVSGINGTLQIRNRVRLDVPETPFVVLNAKIRVQRSPQAALAATPQFAPIVRQSDEERQFESKFWYNPESVDLAIHGRGAYFSTDSLSTKPGADAWTGIYMDFWTDPDFAGEIDIAVSINWYSSLNRLVKRYDMALLALSFVWACLILVYQLITWNNVGVFPSCLQAIERLIRNGIFTAMLAAAAISPVVQIVVARLMKNVWSDATLIKWNNLFMGVRGGGFTLFLVPMLLVVMALGFIVCQAVVLTLICTLGAFINSWVERFTGRTELGETKQPDSSVPVRALLATIMFVAFVSTFVPYQFAFLVIYLAQLIAAARSLATHETHGAYQLGLLLFWTSSLPYCAPELLVWVRNLSVLWFEDAPADHNLMNMAGYFALRLLASYYMVPRLHGEWSSRMVGWMRITTYACFAIAVACAWLLCTRRPYILYSVSNMASMWLAFVHCTVFFLRFTGDRHSKSPVIVNSRGYLDASSSENMSEAEIELNRKLR
ncbi:GPI inositol deacylase [Coemansia brasiliensis]|uniref:GPI inositol-deacylase n=1 Tax=Coemansia brasiliensis TaxID=2650707 RepID=A0A9W8ID31_9FUNG|nr:GPI inositol deacylase [Coemansia brasiliensis]